MLTHEQIWQAIDRLASTFGYSPSGLAKQAGLDATSFNKSKRIGPDGKPRWPSTESISRVLTATGATMSDFIAMVDGFDTCKNKQTATIPVIDFAQVGTQEFFDEEGCPQGDRWNEIQFPDYNANHDDGYYALEISDDSIHPLYRNGDVLVVSPKAQLRNGDRIVLKTTAGDVMVKELVKQNAARIEVKSFNPEHKNEEISMKDISWIGRIIWVSQ